MNTWECLWAGVRLVLIGRTMCGDAWGKPLTRIECTGPNFIHTFSLITLSRRTYTAMHYDSNLMANQVLTRYPTPFFFWKRIYISLIISVRISFSFFFYFQVYSYPIWQSKVSTSFVGIFVLSCENYKNSYNNRSSTSGFFMSKWHKLLLLKAISFLQYSREWDHLSL
jgi:hypothetical protein